MTIQERIRQAVLFFEVPEHHEAITPGFRLSGCECIMSPADFLFGHLQTIQHTRRDENALPYLLRLEYVISQITGV